MLISGLGDFCSKQMDLVESVLVPFDGWIK